MFLPEPAMNKTHATHPTPAKTSTVPAKTGAKTVAKSTVKVESSEVIESYLEALEKTPRPFFLSSFVLYNWIKVAASKIPLGSAAFEQTIAAIYSVINYVQIQTDMRVIVIKDTEVDDLVTQLDAVIADQFIRFDDGLDEMRVLLANALRGLVNSVVCNAKLAADVASTKASELYVVGEQTAANVWTRCEQAQDKAVEMLQYLKKNYPDQCARIEGHLTTVKQTADGCIVKLTDTSVYLLKTAQPFVHLAVRGTEPYLARAVGVSQPYVVQAKPYLEPLLHRVTGVNSALKENKLLGPYVSRGEDLVVKTFEEAKTYCNVNAEAAKPATK
mmetsp:Transcript_6655/g.14421  ORF Transcript_6655/g.14421 Transcript_6655/m.14421 type:complete len:330 (-) Transcript_6655:232-1221(-)